MTSQPGKQRIAINTWHSISKSKENQTMKFGQLIEYNVRNVFLQNHAQKNVEKLFSFFQILSYIQKAVILASQGLTS